MPDRPLRIWIVTARAVHEALAARGLTEQVRVIDVMTIVPAWFRAVFAGG